MVITETTIGTINDASATSHTFSGVTIAAGKLAVLRILVGSDVPTINAPTDSAGNTWSLAILGGRPGDNFQIAIAYAVITNALSSGTVTITLSSAATCGAFLNYFDSDTGWTASPLDKTHTANNNNVTAWSSGATSTTTQADELAVGIGAHVNFGGSLGSTPDAGWTEGSDVIYSNVGGAGMTTVWRQLSATGTYAASGNWQNGEFSASAIATFKPNVTATVTGAAALTGAGSLSSTGRRTSIGAATLTGAGALAAAGVRTRYATAALAGAGSLSAGSTATRFAAAALHGFGTLSAATAPPVVFGRGDTGYIDFPESGLLTEPAAGRATGGTP